MCWRMYKLVSNNYARMKYVLSIIALCCFNFHISQAAFPLERDVRELLEISQPKRWIVFMERIASKCLKDMKTKSPTSLMPALKCMSEGTLGRCLIFERHCILIHCYPNIIKFVGDADSCCGKSQVSIQIFVHRQFNLNVTMVQSNMPPLDSHARVFSPYFEIAKKKFIGPHHPVTTITFRNTIKIKFTKHLSYSTVIEYAVVQNLSTNSHPPMRENALYFPWDDLLVACFQIKVNVRARLSLGIIACMVCKILVYDGPNEKLPIIMQINNTHKIQRVVGSTFQVYVVIIENDYQETSYVTYAPKYRKTAVFNLSKNEYHELNFDNHTHCYGQSLSARLCTYTYYTTNAEKIRFTLIDLNFKGKYQGSSFAAGIFVFNEFGETVVELMKFSSNLPSLEHRDFEIIGTKMHVAIFVYSEFASLSLKFSMFKTNCDILLVSKNYITYSGYVTSVDDTPRAFYVSQSSNDLPEYDRCFQFHFFEIEDKIVVIFPPNTQVMMTTKGFTFYEHDPKPCKTSFNPLAIRYYVPYSYGEYLKSLRIVSSITHLIVSNCLPNTYMQIRIWWLPCKLLCRYLDPEKICNMGSPPAVMWHDGHNETCNICENRYTNCGQMLLKNNISISIGLKPNLCMYVYLSIRNRITDRSPAIMMLILNKYNMISRIPDFTQSVDIWVSSERCVLEIPKATLRTNTTDTFSKLGAALDAVQAVYWGDVLYQGLFSPRLVSWEEAAQSCQGIRASLLTIHSLAEYTFIKETFLQLYDTFVLFVGLQREVMQVINFIKK